MAARAVGQHHLLRRLVRFSSSISRASSPLLTSDISTTSQAAVRSHEPLSLVSPQRFFVASAPEFGSRHLQQQRLSFCSAAKDAGCIDVTPPPREADDIAAPATADEDSAHKPSKRHDLAMLFTCKVCETRSGKTMSRATYETGIVIVRCPNCRNLHLIADRLGWFGEPGSVEDFLQQQGVAVRKGLEESYEFSVDDLAGWTPKAKP